MAHLAHKTNRNKQSATSKTSNHGTNDTNTTPQIRLFLADEMMRMGLEMVGFDLEWQENVSRAVNVKRFQSHYGSSPLVCAVMWEDLVASNTLKARVKPKHYFISLHFLKRYPTQEGLAGVFGLCEETASLWVWYFAEKIQALKSKKIVWPEEWAHDYLDVSNIVPEFLYSVDGIHCRTNEPFHPTLAKDTKAYSHKFNQAGVTYELAMALHSSDLVWMNGPKKAAMPDITVFREAGGLKEMTPVGKRGIGDYRYRGERDTLSTPNSHDPRALRKFKSRARARQESFNARIKHFAVLDHRFRHTVKQHQICFEAICVIVQYQMENGAPLFSL